MSTLRDIAKYLNISTATVSRALNDKPGVSDEVRQQVLRAASEMNYVPNVAAQGLVNASTSTRTVGFVCVDHGMPISSDPFYLHVMRGAEQELARRGYFLIVSTVNASSLTNAADLQILKEKRVDGLILAGPYFSQRFILAVCAAGMPLVLVDNAVEKTPVDCVMASDEQAACEAVSHLLEHGHQKIVAISGPKDWASNRARAAGYRRAMDEANLPARVFHQPATTSDTGYAAMQEVFQQAPDVTAIFAINDAMAFGVMRAAKEHGRSIPEDLALVGFDDVELSAHLTPPLTTMRVPKQQLGILAGRRLVDILQKHEGEAPVISMAAVKLIVRNSCGCKGDPA